MNANQPHEPASPPRASAPTQRIRGTADERERGTQEREADAGSPAGTLRRSSLVHVREELEGPVSKLGYIAGAVVRRIQQRPLTSLAAAVGIGFVVGGALSFRAGRLALAAALRHVGRELLKQVL